MKTPTLLLLLTVLSLSRALRSPPRVDGVIFNPQQSRVDSSYYRLPTNVVPKSYTLLLEPLLQEDVFNGNVDILVDVVEETSSVTLHAAQITFSEVAVFDSSGNAVEVEDVKEEADRDFRILEFGSPLSVGEYRIRIGYAGILNGDNHGFYRSNYTNSKGEFRRLATTQFEATSARYAFPCFDEPALKATFTISIIRDSDYNSISNMPLSYSTRLSDGRYLDEFETSVPMSTYLVAFIVSDFTYVEKGNQRVYAQPDYISYGDGDFALDVGGPVIAALESYTYVPYALKKMYQISLPHFSAGAMENWGLVTYRESALLYNSSTKTVATKQSIEVVISHEFTHQWFGDLVGPQWWTYLWLNEGFASFLQYEIGGKVKPAWRLSEQLVVAYIQSALSVDATVNTRPMSQDAGSPSEISNLFDTIAYAKSGAVLRMLQHAITEDAFREGLRVYLTDRQYKAATGDDLWENIQKAVNASFPNVLPEGYTVPEVMGTWEHQAGYPLVTVTRNYSNGRATLSQERFIFNDANHGIETKWYVPINYATPNDIDFEDTKAVEWITPSADLVLDLNLNAEDFLIVNKQFACYFRTNYDEENWKLIASYLDSDNFDKIPPLTRAGLLNDAFILARAGRLKYSVALELTKYLHRETDYIPLKSLFNEFTNFNQLFRGLEGFELFEAKFGESLETAVNELGAVENAENSTDDEHVNTLNRIQVINWACNYGSTLCRQLTTERLSDPAAISLDLRSTVLCAGMRGANAEIFNAIYEQSLTEEDASLKNSLASALGCSENEELLDSYIKRSLSEGNSVFSNIYSQSNFGLRYVFSYLQNNLEHVYQSLGATTTGSLIRSLASYLRSPNQLAQLQALSASNTVEDLNSAFSSAITTVSNNVASTSAFNDDVLSWLDKEFGSNDDDDDDGGNDDDDDDDDNGNDDDDGGNGGNDEDEEDNGASVVSAALSVALAFTLTHLLM